MTLCYEKKQKTLRHFVFEGHWIVEYQMGSSRRRIISNQQYRGCSRKPATPDHHCVHVHFVISQYPLYSSSVYGRCLLEEALYLFDALPASAPQSMGKQVGGTNVIHQALAAFPLVTRPRFV